MDVSKMTFDDLAKIITDFFYYHNDFKIVRKIDLIVDEIPYHLIYGKPCFFSAPTKTKKIDRVEIKIGNKVYHSIGLYKQFSEATTVQALDRKAFEKMVNDYRNIL